MAQKSIKFGRVSLAKTPRNSCLEAGSQTEKIEAFRSHVLGSEIILTTESAAREALDVSKRLFFEALRYSTILIGWLRQGRSGL